MMCVARILPLLGTARVSAAAVIVRVPRVLQAGIYFLYVRIAPIVSTAHKCVRCHPTTAVFSVWPDTTMGVSIETIRVFY